MSWQGKPPQMMSTGGTVDQSTAVMSPKLGTPGQWVASTLDALVSTSQCQAAVAPNTSSTARSRPPMPENRDP